MTPQQRRYLIKRLQSMRYTLVNKLCDKENETRQLVNKLAVERVSKVQLRKRWLEILTSERKMLYHIGSCPSPLDFIRATFTQKEMYAIAGVTYKDYVHPNDVVDAAIQKATDELMLGDATDINKLIAELHKTLGIEQ